MCVCCSKVSYIISYWTDYLMSKRVIFWMEIKFCSYCQGHSNVKLRWCGKPLTLVYINTEWRNIRQFQVTTMRRFAIRTLVILTQVWSFEVMTSMFCNKYWLPYCVMSICEDKSTFVEMATPYGIQGTFKYIYIYIYIYLSLYTGMF
jgi:hypothetical protein